MAVTLKDEEALIYVNLPTDGQLHRCIDITDDIYHHRYDLRGKIPFSSYDDPYYELFLDDLKKYMRLGQYENDYMFSLDVLNNILKSFMEKEQSVVKLAKIIGENSTQLVTSSQILDLAIYIKKTYIF